MGPGSVLRGRQPCMIYTPVIGQTPSVVANTRCGARATARHIVFCVRAELGNDRCPSGETSTRWCRRFCAFSSFRLLGDDGIFSRVLMLRLDVGFYVGNTSVLKHSMYIKLLYSLSKMPPNGLSTDQKNSRSKSLQKTVQPDGSVSNGVKSL